MVLVYHAITAFKASSMLQILHYIWKHDKTLGLINLLPSSGESGTLQYRRSMREEMIKKNQSQERLSTERTIWLDMV